MRKMRTAIVATIVLSMSAPLAAAQAVSPREPTLTVRGQGRVQVPPDHAKLTVEAVTKAKSLEAATSAHRNRATRAANALAGMKTDGIEVERSVFRLNEVRPPMGANAPGRAEPEYQAVTTFELKTAKLNRVDAAVTALAATGLFEVRNLQFEIDEKNPGIAAARKAAVDDARERATTYAQAAGVVLGDILRIDDTDGRGPRDFAVGAPMMRSVQVAPPEALTLTASVTMTWRIGAGP
jgi:uncharacterized protein